MTLTCVFTCMPDDRLGLLILEAKKVLRSHMKVSKWLVETQIVGDMVRGRVIAYD